MKRKKVKTLSLLKPNFVCAVLHKTEWTQAGYSPSR